MTEQTRRRNQLERIARNQERRGWRSRRGRPIQAHSLDWLYPRPVMVKVNIPLGISQVLASNPAPLKISWWSRLVYWLRNL